MWIGILYSIINEGQQYLFYCVSALFSFSKLIFVTWIAHYLKPKSSIFKKWKFCQHNCQTVTSKNTFYQNCEIIMPQGQGLWFILLKFSKTNLSVLLIWNKISVDLYWKKLAVNVVFQIRDVVGLIFILHFLQIGITVCLAEWRDIL